MGAQFGIDKHFGNPVTEAIDNTSELASTSIEQQGMPVIDETAEDNCEHRSTQHHHELEYLPR